MSDYERQREIWGRLVLFVVAIPFFGLVTLILPGRNHLALAIATTVATPFASNEVLRLLLGHDRKSFVWLLAVILSALMPVLTYLEIIGVVGPHALLGFLAGATCGFLVICTVGSSEPNDEPIRKRVSSSVLVLIYPGLLISYVVRMGSLDHAGKVLLAFFIIVFGIDIAGYLSGRLTRSRPLGLAVSPNKTATGFIGSFLMGVILGFVSTLLFPNALSLSPVAAIGIGAAMSIATMTGDLVESALKRAAAVKHSGRHIPGRGGLMDSIDSILFAAPVFYAAIV